MKTYTAGEVWQRIKNATDDIEFVILYQRDDSNRYDEQVDRTESPHFLAFNHAAYYYEYSEEEEDEIEVKHPTDRVYGITVWGEDIRTGGFDSDTDSDEHILMLISVATSHGVWIENGKSEKQE